MYYYNLLIGGQSYHGHEALTYSYDQELKTGSIVLVSMRNKKYSAIVVSATSKPTFNVKPITQLLISKPMPKQSVDLLIWLKEYYPSTTGVITSLFLPSGLLKKEVAQTNTKTASPAQTLPLLTPDQKNALGIIAKMEAGTSCILHGDTGTGKTRVYIELIKQTIASNQHSLVLTPEIGLTSQLASTIRESVTAEVIVVHSNQTTKQRRESWLKVLNATKPIVVVGPRSALFAPFGNLGLIVVDEAHDNAYKQDQSPHYHSLRAASKLAQIQGAKLIFGSATPLISEYYVAEQKNITIIRMTHLAVDHPDFKQPKIVTIDQTDRSLFSKNSHLSDPMIGAIGASLDNKEQSLIFLNRRGTARLVICQDCGRQALCPNCDLPLTYHADKHTMTCHTCGYREHAITSCPVCHSTNIIYKSMGTKAIADSLARIFPTAKIKRFDTDNTKSDSLDEQYTKVKAGGVDILVGTQMLVKGHDLPKLSTVGIVSADTSLSFPDFTAEEQTYQLLTQAIGRVGRGHRSGNVVIQTYNSGGVALKAAVNKNWDEFYKQQIAERKHYLFPPFCFILKLTCKRKSQTGAANSAKNLAESLRKSRKNIQILGPTPCYVEKANGYFAWQIIIKSKSRPILTDIINNLPANWSYDIDPVNLL